MVEKFIDGMSRMVWIWPGPCWIVMWMGQVFIVHWSPQQTLVPSFFSLLSSSAIFVLGLFMYDFMWFIKSMYIFGECVGLRGCVQGVHRRVWVCSGVCGYAWVCAGVRGWCAGVRGCTQVSTGVHRSTLVCVGVCGCGCMHGCMCVCVGWIFRIPTGDLSPTISGV